MQFQEYECTITEGYFIEGTVSSLIQTHEPGKNNDDVTSLITGILLPTTDFRVFPAEIFNVFKNLLRVDFTSLKIVLLIAGDLRNLRFFRHTFDHLDRLNMDSFALCPDLESIDIWKHQIRMVDVDAFRGLNKLAYLTIAGHQITFIEPETFVHTPNLRYLNLAENSITNFADFIKPLTALQSLDLFSNNIQVIPLDAFAHLRDFHSLKLDDNFLRSFDGRLLSHLPNFFYLSLNLNFLQSFSLPISVSYLELDYNPISVINANILPLYARVVKLSMQHCQLNEIHPLIFNYFQFGDLNLQGNSCIDGNFHLNYDQNVQQYLPRFETCFGNYYLPPTASPIADVVDKII